VTFCLLLVLSAVMPDPASKRLRRDRHRRDDRRAAGVTHSGHRARDALNQRRNLLLCIATVVAAMCAVIVLAFLL
jgi:hypothetical protein